MINSLVEPKKKSLEDTVNQQSYFSVIKAMFHRAAFRQHLKFWLGLGRSLNKRLRSAAGRRLGLFQKFMKPALLADAR